MMQAFFEVELIFIVPPESFEPAPKVDSKVVFV
jgi:16S rRNA (adenine1518-N6/adenine1519-N6)-dimethyltransferase